MAKYEKISTVDGYAAVKAAARAGKGPVLAHTVIPAKHIIQCYECGYSFQLHGKAARINCSKCRAILDISDHTITGKSDQTLKTAGMIRISSDACIEAGEIVAGDIILAGTVAGGKLRAMRRLELEAGASFPENAVAATDLKIARGALIVFDQPARYRDVEVVGTMRARLEASGSVIIRAGGWLDGGLQTEHLVVEDGGGLSGSVELRRGSPATDEPEVPSVAAR